MIVDDEPGAVNLLEVLIRQATGWQLMSKCYNALEAISFLKNNEVDLVFMDINMPLINGIELATLLPKKNGIVFTTAYSEYAAESYTFNTLDYLLKPIVLSRFLASVQKVENYFKNENISDEYFFVKSGSELRKILLSEILFFESRKEYVGVVTMSFEILTYRRLKDIEAQLPSSFVRVHQSYIVNLSQLVKIRDNHIHIGEKRIPIGDKFREGLMELVRKRTF
ncbi:LytTR family DNA-binding domain-containing protein [Chitinophaga oryziterrae]